METSQPIQPRQYSIWDFPTRWEDYQLDRFLILEACKKNNIEIFMRLFHKTEWTPFQLMISTIYGNERGSDIFSFLLTRLSPKDMKTTFRVYDNGIEHTLLSYYCSRISFRERLELVQAKFTSLLEAGSEFDQEINGNKTALSFLVESDFNFYILKWCIEALGANPHKGYLLHFACNSISKEENEKRVAAQIAYSAILNNNNTPMAEPEEITTSSPHENIRLYRYLLSLGLDLEECMEETGLTPLLAVCSEGNTDKVNSLLQFGGANISLYRKTKDNLDVWYWAEFYKFKNWGDDGYTYPLRDLLLTHKAAQTIYWEEIMEEMGDSILQNVQVHDILSSV